MQLNHSPDSKNILEFLFVLAIRPRVAVVSICGISGAGKTTLAHALKSLPMQVTTVGLDSWLIYSAQERYRRLLKAEASGDQERIAAARDPLNLINFDKFARDFKRLLSAGSLRLEKVHDPISGELTACANFDIASQAPRLVVLEGSRVLHSPVRELADYAMCLDVGQAASDDRRWQRDKIKFTREQHDKYRGICWEEWATYREKFLGRADVVLDAPQLDALHKAIKLKSRRVRPAGLAVG